MRTQNSFGFVWALYILHLLQYCHGAYQNIWFELQQLSKVSLKSLDFILCLTPMETIVKFLFNPFSLVTRENQQLDFVKKDASSTLSLGNRKISCTSQLPMVNLSKSPSVCNTLQFKSLSTKFSPNSSNTLHLSFMERITTPKRNQSRRRGKRAFPSCIVCNRTFSSQKQLTQNFCGLLHKKTVRAKLELNKELKSDLCFKFFIRKHDLLDHRMSNAYHAALQRFIVKKN